MVKNAKNSNDQGKLIGKNAKKFVWVGNRQKSKANVLFAFE